MDFAGIEISDLKGIGTLLALLFLFAARRKKKEAEAREQDLRNYEPIEPDRPDPGVKTISPVPKLLSGVHRLYSIIVVVAIVAAVFYASPIEQTTGSGWIILGVFAVLALIYLVKKARESDVTPDFNHNDPREE